MSFSLHERSERRVARPAYMMLTLGSLVISVLPAHAEISTFTQPIEALTFYRERPLFSPTRRPSDVTVPVEESAAPSLAQPLNAVLLGVVSSTDGTGVVILRIDGQTDVQRVRIGESVNGWQLDRIESHVAIFTSGEDRTSLTFPAADAAMPMSDVQVPPEIPEGMINQIPK